MDYACPYRNAFYWSVEFSKKSCYHNGKVKLPPLSEYDDRLKELQFNNRRFGVLIRECAALIVSKDGDIPTNNDLCVYPKDLPKGVTRDSVVNNLSYHLDPRIFPIIFPSGDLGWNPTFKQNENRFERLTPFQYYSYRLAYRPRSKFSATWYCGMLT
ncbi:hypothetical protein TSAR_005094 [Trichomalopsis sarcophagae]|uniref:Helitron helicase-like domain-containing protein n=1 Tax=Trichomalopsis sarcophagae TaxID=543379 RepID=A0A232FLW2_9HYME|nr:hypothetical protein TSAR_005094 [Trichomalopsis sarcophagae]